MALLGSVPITQILFTAAADPNDINASSGATVELEDALTDEIMSIEVISSLAAPAVLYRGPDSALEALMIIPGGSSVNFVLPRQPIALPQGDRLSIRAQADAAIVTGTVILNLWG